MANSDSTKPSKVCTQCGIEKPLTDYHKLKTVRDGRKSECKACNCARAKAYVARNSEKVKASKAAYRQANKDRESAARKAYYLRHQDELREKTRRYYQEHKEANKEKKSAADKLYRERNKERIAAQRKAYREQEAKKAANKARCKAWYEQNKERQSAYGKELYQQNREQIIARVRAYEKANPEKVRLLGRVKAHRRRGWLLASPDHHTRQDIDDLYQLQKGKCANCRTSLKEGYHVDHRIPLAKGGSNGRQNLDLLCPACNCRKSAIDPIEFAQHQGRLL